MRRLVVTQNITVDGVVEASEGWFDPTDDSEQGRQLAEATREQAAASDGFLVGRVTFEQMRGFWPRQRDDRTGVTEHLNRVDKYVVSRTLDDPGWAGTTVLGGDLEQEIRKLKDGPGTEIVTTGSITLMHTLFRSGLVDEVRLFQHPVVLGSGRRLFPEGVRLPDLELAEHRTLGEVALLRYIAR